MCTLHASYIRFCYIICSSTMERYFYSAIFHLVCLASTVSNEVYYIEPWQLPNNTESYNHLSLSQFVNKSSAYLTNDTRLVFAAGSYSLDSGLIIENVHAFSMSSETISSSKAVHIVCAHNSRFEFRNVRSVTVSGFDFVGCFENHIEFVGLLQLENSNFTRASLEKVDSTQLIITKTSACIDRVAFMSVDDNQLQMRPHIYRVIFAIESAVVFTQNWFEGYNVGGGKVLHSENGCNITIFNTTFVNNRALDCFIGPGCRLGNLLYANKSNVHIINSKIINNHDFLRILYTVNTNMSTECVIDHCNFFNNSGPFLLRTENTIVRIKQSDFVENTHSSLVSARTHENNSVNVFVIDHCKFLNNSGYYLFFSLDTNLSIRKSEFVRNSARYSLVSVSNFLYTEYAMIMTISQSEFINNTATSGLIFTTGEIFLMTFNKFINNNVSDSAVVYTQYITTVENVNNNVFTENAGMFDIFINPLCRPNHSLSIGSSRCIECNGKWHQNLAGLVIAAFVAGIALVILILTLNITVAVGTLNGILFYANVVAARAETFFFPFKTHTFVTVFISWFNLDIGFDVCLFKDMNLVHKALIQLAFPTYIIILVVTVIVASECSSRFAKLIGKGNPVAALATMILLSYAKFFNVILNSSSLLYLQPAYGSRNVHVDNIGNSALDIAGNNSSLTLPSYFLIAFSILLFLLCTVYTTLVFSWQWLLHYQHKAIFKWVRYQKLCHFLEPNHAPYTQKYRYWTGLLLIVRVLLFLSSLMNFSLDPRVDMMSTILVVGGLLILKGLTTKRIYKSWPLDVMETAIYFNLIVFSAITWYNLDFGGNQEAAAYISVMIVFIHLLGVIAFHVLRYTSLYKCSFVEKTFKWIFSNIIDHKPKEESVNTTPEELDGYQLERSAVGDQPHTPTVTHSVIEMYINNQQESNV